MTFLESWLWGLCLCLFALGGLVGRKPGLWRSLPFMLLPLLTSVWAAHRWISVGHAPVFGTFENTLSAAWIISLGMPYLALRKSEGRLAMAADLGWVGAALLLWGRGFNDAHIPLTISEQSLWPEFHALFGWFAFFALTAAFILALRTLAARTPNGPVQRLRDERTLLWMFWGFFYLSICIALGSIFEFLLLGRWWSWDFIETTTTCSVLALGLAIHSRLFHRWGGKSLAWLVVLSYFFLCFAAWGLALFPQKSAFHYFELGF